jgi:hypothetical protein
MLSARQILINTNEAIRGMIRELTDNETAALQAFAARHGHSWKEQLAGVYWYNARVWHGHHCLYALRNDPAWGHEGLRRYRLPKPA